MLSFRLFQTESIGPTGIVGYFSGSTSEGNIELAAECTTLVLQNSP
jgi:hypothetical protein